MNCKRCNKPIEAHEAGRETDACVAEVVMGWPTIGDSDPYRWYAHHGGVICHGTPQRFPRTGGIPDNWSPSTDANAMLEVVEEMRRDVGLWIWGRSGTGATVHLTDADGFHALRMSADTPQLAVCRAALAAKGGA